MSDILKTLMEVRKARRAMRLRDEVDPDVVARGLETILKEVIASRSADSGVIGRAALEEIKQIRNDLIAKQINAGQKTSLLIGKYSLVIDEMNNLKESMSEGDGSDGALVSAVKSITDNIPSAQTITSALITANPFLGYGAKIIMDMFTSVRERRESIKQLRERQMSILEGQARNLEQQLEDLERQSDVTDKQEKMLDQESNDPDDSGECDDDCDIPYDSEVVSSLLEDVRDEMHKLYLIWADEDENILTDDERYQQTLERMAGLQEDTNSNLEKLIESQEETSDLERLREDNLEYMNREAELEKRSEDISNDGVQQKIEKGLSPLEQKLLDDVGSDFDVGTFQGAYLGVIAGKALGVIKALLTPFKTLGALAIGFARRIGPVALLVEGAMALFNFADGWINAADILGKNESELTLGDKLAVSSASVAAHFVSLADTVDRYVREVIAHVTGDEEWLKEEEAKTKEEITKSLAENFSDFGDRFSNTLSRMKETIAANLYGWFDRFVENITSSWDFMMDGLSDWLEKMNPITRLRNWMNDYREEVQDRPETWVEDLDREAYRRINQPNLIKDEGESFFDRIFKRIMNDSAGFEQVSNGYLNLGDIDYSSQDRSNGFELTEENTTQMDSIIERIESDNKEETINNNSSVNFTPINNVTNNNIGGGGGSARPQVRIGPSSNTEPSFRRVQSLSDSFAY